MALASFLSGGSPSAGAGGQVEGREPRRPGGLRRKRIDSLPLEPSKGTGKVALCG